MLRTLFWTYPRRDEKRAGIANAVFLVQKHGISDNGKYTATEHEGASGLDSVGEGAGDQDADKSHNVGWDGE